MYGVGLWDRLTLLIWCHYSLHCVCCDGKWKVKRGQRKTPNVFSSDSLKYYIFTLMEGLKGLYLK